MDLFDAIEAEDLSELSRLIAEGADVNDNDFDDRQMTPLEAACERGNPAVVEALVEAGAKPGVGVFRAPIVPAAAFGFTSIVDRLLQSGADPDGCDEEGMTALSHAATFGFKDIARLLIQAGADPTRQDNDGYSPIGSAQEDGHEELAAYLQDPASFPETHAFWRDAGELSGQASDRERAALAQPEEAVEFELDTSRYKKGFVVERLGEGVITRDFANVCNSGEVDIARDMLDAGLAVDWRFMGVAPTGVMSAARSGRLAVIELLIERGADVNLRDERDQSALHYALMDPSAPKHGDVIKRLLEAGCDPTLGSDQGASLLAMAERWKADDIVEMLRDAGVGPDG